MEKIYKFQWNYGRMGYVEGVFIADEKRVEKAIGKHIYFGEILGKHSEVAGDLESKDIKLLTGDPAAIKILRDIFKSDTISGHNPLEHIICQICGDEEEYCECKEDE